MRHHSLLMFFDNPNQQSSPPLSLPSPASSAAPSTTTPSSSSALKAHLELVSLDDLVQVGTEEFERDAHVIPENEVVEHLYDIVLPFLVLLPQVLQDPNLLLGLSKSMAWLNDHIGMRVDSEGSIPANGRYVFATQLAPTESPLG